MNDCACHSELAIRKMGKSCSAVLGEDFPKRASMDFSETKMAMKSLRSVLTSESSEEFKKKKKTHKKQNPPKNISS